MTRTNRFLKVPNPTRSRSMLLPLLAAGAFSVALAGAARPAHAFAYFHRINASPQTPFIVIAGHSPFTVRHTWGNSFSFDDSFDLTQSWMSGHAYCEDANSASGCSRYYLPTSFYRQAKTDEKTWFRIRNQYKRNQPGIYLVNGVCHQATNRATRASNLPTVMQVGVTGGTISQVAFGTCGKLLPFVGPNLGCP